VTAALPLLRHAREVTVLAWTDGGALAGHGGDDPLRLRRLQVWLSGHDIEARIEPQGPSPATGLGELLLSAAADHGSDLLVLGCYGHARFREWVFGGVTRTILGSMTLPVLMSH
jgi:nucleotide-binding universal stress UspA family protein